MCQMSAIVSFTIPKGSHKNSKLVKITLLKAGSSIDQVCVMSPACIQVTNYLIRQCQAKHTFPVLVCDSNTRLDLL